MPKKQNFCFSTGFTAPVSSHYTLNSYQVTGDLVNNAVAVVSGCDDTLINAVGTASGGVDFDKSGKIEQINIFVGESIASTQSPKSRSPLSPSTTLRFVELLTLLPYCRFSSWLVDRAVIAAEGRAA